MDLNLNDEQKSMFEAMMTISGLCVVVSFLGSAYLIRKHQTNWVNVDIQMPVCKITCFNLIGSIIFLLCVYLVNFYSIVELFYDIFLAYFLHVYYNQLIKTLVAYEIRQRYENNEDAEFFNKVRREDPTSYILFVKTKNMTEENFLEVCLAMSLRKIEKGTLAFFINQTYDNMTTCKNKVLAYNNVVKNWILLTLVALFMNILLNHMIGFKVKTTLYLIRGMQCILESYLIAILLMISSILSDGTNNRNYLSVKKKEIVQEELEKYDIKKTETHCFCIKMKSEKYKEKIEEMTHQELSILRNTALEMKFVSIKLIPGTLCTLSVLMAMIPFDEDDFPQPQFENLIVFVSCSILNALMIFIYIYGYNVDKFDFERYNALYEQSQQFIISIKNQKDINGKKIKKMYQVNESDFDILAGSDDLRRSKRINQSNQTIQNDVKIDVKDDNKKEIQALQIENEKQNLKY